MNRDTYRNKWLRYRDRYERAALREFNKSIKAAVSEIPFEKISRNTYVPVIDFHISDETIKKTYYDLYLRLGLMHGKRIGSAIRKERKNFEFSSFETVYRSFLEQWLLNNAGTRITSVRQSLADYLIQIIANGIADGKDIQTIAREMRKLVGSRNFYGWQALRIARTETTAAANLGALIAGRESNLIMVKEWISALDPRTRQIEKGDRFDHWDMDGIVVDQDALFDVNGELIRFPGDPKGSAANIINCRCTIATYGKRDADGNLIFKN